VSPAAYAAGTTVSAEKSKAEIERTLERFGATGFAYGWDAGRGIARIEFVLEGRRVRFTLRLPDKEDRAFTHTARNQRRTAESAKAAYAQESRRLWRAMGLVVKAKLEAVGSGIVSLEEEFLAHTVLPDNTTVGEWAADQLKEVYASGQMPALLPGTSQLAALPPGSGDR
jgi:hypothetical protein